MNKEQSTKWWAVLEPDPGEYDPPFEFDEPIGFLVDLAHQIAVRQKKARVKRLPSKA